MLANLYIKLVLGKQNWLFDIQKIARELVNVNREWAKPNIKLIKWVFYLTFLDYIVDKHNYKVRTYK